MSLIVPLILIGFGVALLLIGTRPWLLGAGIGALLGLGLLRLLPGEQSGAFALLVVLALAAVAGFFAGVTKGVVGLVVMALGFLAGGAMAFAVLDLLGGSFGLIDWLLSLVAAVVVAVLARRFSSWALIVLAGLVGALLVVRGVQLWFPSFQGLIAAVTALALAGGSIGYQGGWIGGRTRPAAA
jgi:hypothetical protein